MMDFMFFVKTMLFTFAIILVMQIEVGDQSIETHAMSWVQSSAVAGNLKGISRGAARMVHDLTHKISDSIHNNVNKNSKGDSALRKDSPFHWLQRRPKAAAAPSAPSTDAEAEGED